MAYLDISAIQPCHGDQTKIPDYAERKGEWKTSKFTGDYWQQELTIPFSRAFKGTNRDGSPTARGC